MRKVPCFNPECWSRRVHHERPDVPRGQRFVEVPDDWDGTHAFCSMMCACEAGFMSMSLRDPLCKKCFVASGGNSEHHHHPQLWTCFKPEPPEGEFERLWAEREARIAAFKEKYEKKCPRCGDKRSHEERYHGNYVTVCTGCWLPVVEWDTWTEEKEEKGELKP